MPVLLHRRDAYHSGVTIRLASDGRPAGRLVMIVKSAHVYETERAYVLGVLAGAR